jgi:hypothetical protein
MHDSNRAGSFARSWRCSNARPIVLEPLRRVEITT